MEDFGKKLEEISRIVGEIRDTQMSHKHPMQGLIGPPSLEDRLREYVDEAIQTLEEKNDEQHKENCRKLDSLEKWQQRSIGALALLMVLLKLFIK
jgi:hypothetical protein